MKKRNTRSRKNKRLNTSSISSNSSLRSATQPNNRQTQGNNNPGPSSQPAQYHSIPNYDINFVIREEEGEVIPPTPNQVSNVRNIEYVILSDTEEQMNTPTTPPNSSRKQQPITPSPSDDHNYFSQPQPETRQTNPNTLPEPQTEEPQPRSTHPAAENQPATTPPGPITPPTKRGTAPL